MVHIARWKMILIALVVVWGVVYSAPNLLSSETRDWIENTLPSFMPHKTVNLGLDLQGGAHLLLQVAIDEVLKERIDDLEASSRDAIRKEKLGYKKVGTIPNGIRVTPKNAGDAQKIKKIIRRANAEVNVLDSDNGAIDVTFTEQALKGMVDQTMSQSVEIVRRRVDETGTREPIIQRQGEDRILLQLPGIDDPQQIIGLLDKTAKLSFHLVDTDTGRSIGTRNLPLIEEPGRTVPIKRRAILTGEMLTNAQTTLQDGMPVVSFRLNGVGTRRFCDVTRNNVGKPFAIVLDDEVISAPNIRDAICGGSAVISGRFTVQEASDLALLLRAGALPASLKIVEERTVGPSLGADSVEAGKIASIVGLVLIFFFMTFTYSLFGIFANLALVINVALIFALLSGLQATLTLPGIAGIVLTIGMAVDANVLIFERIREELGAGRSVLSAIDAGYSRAMSTIVDSNLTTLIAAVLLYSFGTGPVKGFAVTLGIGIMTSLFAAIMLTRLFVVLWVQKKRPTTLPI